MAKNVNLVGKRFDRLLVVEYLGLRKRKDGRNNKYWKCICDCGNVVELPSGYILSNKIHSCGCYKKEKLHDLYFKGGKSKLYDVWRMMKKRCLDKNNPHYHNYGARGITICDEWLCETGYENFRKWAESHGYKEGLTLDRTDNNKGYCPDNCCWADRKRQSNNKRNNLYFTIDGVTHTLAEWCEIYNVPYARVDARINTLGWSFEDALFKGRRYSIYTITYKGETKTTKEWAKLTGLSTDIIRNRLKNGWTPEEIIETPKMVNGGSSEWRKIHRLQNQKQH